MLSRIDRNDCARRRFGVQQVRNRRGDVVSRRAPVEKCLTRLHVDVGRHQHRTRRNRIDAQRRGEGRRGGAGEGGELAL